MELSAETKGQVMEREEVGNLFTPDAPVNRALALFAVATAAILVAVGTIRLALTIS